VNDAVILEDGVDKNVSRWRRHVHDVHVDQLLVLALGILQDDLVDAGLLALGIDDVQLDPVPVDGELNVFADLEDLAVLLDKDLQIGLLLSFNLL
jgi:hypothetical protein